jgi:type II secretory pathway component PulF
MGAPLQILLSRIKYFPPLVNQMMKVGESTGNLDSNVS